MTGLPVRNHGVTSRNPNITNPQSFGKFEIKLTRLNQVVGVCWAASTMKKKIIFEPVRWSQPIAHIYIETNELIPHLWSFSEVFQPAQSSRRKSYLQRIERNKTKTAYTRTHTQQKKRRGEINISHAVIAKWNFEIRLAHGVILNHLWCNVVWKGLNQALKIAEENRVNVTLEVISA